ncbi:ParB/RepB/Spo0J family partition protein [Treponema lecithinolyticum]
MPKLEPAGLTQKISLSQIIDTGNVREDYHDIAELAQSIKDNGLMQPVVVKRAGTTPDGIQQYELIAGHRRKKAHEYLCAKGDDFNMIDAVVKTGDKLTLQLIENIQRNDLTAAERENGLAEMLNSGVSQKEIAGKLSKSEQWVSKHLAAYKIRQFLNTQKIDTEKYETSTLNLFRTIPEPDLKTLIEKTESAGGTRAAAETVIREYKEKQNPTETYTIEKQTETQEIDIPVFKSKKTETLKPNTRETAKINRINYSEKIEPEDKLLSSKFVFGEIETYIKAVKNKKELLEDETLKTIQQAKMDAAYDIIALLHANLP